MVVNRFEALRSGTTPLVGRDEEFDLMVGLFITLQSFQRSAAVQPLTPANGCNAPTTRN
jgi:hypothetical protein